MKQPDKENFFLEVMIRFSAFEDKDTFEVLKQIDEKRHEKTLRLYRQKYKFYVHRYVALSYIYQSMINIANTFSYFDEHKKALIHEREKNIYLAMNEPFAQGIIIQYAKLKEALVDIYSDEPRDIALKERLLKNKSVEAGYSALSELYQKIKESNVEDLRNTIFAHPFKADKKNVIYPYEATENILSTFKSLCDEPDNRAFSKSKNRIAYFCNQYLMKASRILYLRDKNKNSIKTNAQKHVRIINEFMCLLRDEYFFGYEPILIPDEKTMKKFIVDNLK